MKNHLNFGCKLISFLMLLSFIVYGWKIPYVSFQVVLQWWPVHMSWALYFIATTVLFLFLNFAAMYGLFFIKKWGFIVAYCAIIFSTIFCGYPYIPFIGKIFNNLFSIGPRYISLIVINLIVICYVGYLHVLYRRLNK